MLNADYKILATTLANRMSNVINLYVHKDQTGFKCGRYLKDNTCRVMYVISKAQSDSSPKVLFLGAEKAFNCIEWRYLHIVYEKFGLGPFLQSWVRLLYRYQTAIINVDGVNS